MIQTGILISDRKHTGLTLINLPWLILRKHNVVDKGIVLAFLRKRSNQNDRLVLPKLIFPAPRGKIWVGRIVYHRRVVVCRGHLVRPPSCFRTQRCILIWSRRKAKHHIGGPCVVAETAHEFSFRSQLDGIQFPEQALLNIKAALFQIAAKRLRPVALFRRGRDSSKHENQKHTGGKRKPFLCPFHFLLLFRTICSDHEYCAVRAR